MLQILNVTDTEWILEGKVFGLEPGKKNLTVGQLWLGKSTSEA